MSARGGGVSARRCSWTSISDLIKTGSQKPQFLLKPETHIRASKFETLLTCEYQGQNDCERFAGLQNLHLGPLCSDTFVAFWSHGSPGGGGWQRLSSRLKRLTYLIASGHHLQGSHCATLLARPHRKTRERLERAPFCNTSPYNRI